MQGAFPKRKEIEDKQYEKFMTGTSKEVDQYLEDYKIPESYYYRTFKDGNKRHLYLRPKLNK